MPIKMKKQDDYQALGWAILLFLFAALLAIAIILGSEVFNFLIARP